MIGPRPAGCGFAATAPAAPDQPPPAHGVRRRRARPRPGCRRAGTPSRRVAASASAWATISVLVRHQRAGLRARHQPPVGACSRGRGSPRGRPPGRPPAASVEQPARHAQHRQVAGAVEHRPRLLLVVEHPVVERAVRLEVAHRRCRRPRRSRRRVPTWSATWSRSTAYATSRGHPAEARRSSYDPTWSATCCEHVGGDVARDPAEAAPGRRRRPGRRPRPRAGPPPRTPRA